MSLRIGFRPYGKAVGVKSEDIFNEVMLLVRKDSTSIFCAPDIEMRNRVIREKVSDAMVRTTEKNLTLPRPPSTRWSRISSPPSRFGPLERLLRDPEVSEIMTMGPKKIYVEKKGKLLRSEVEFTDDKELLEVIEKIMKPLGRMCDEKTPYQDARLPDGSRVNVVIPPLALDGAAITIRKFSKNKLTYKDLIRFGALTEEMAQLLRACVERATSPSRAEPAPAKPRFSTFSPLFRRTSGP